MRELVRRYRQDRDRIITEYAAAETRREVTRKSNIHNIPAIEYAKRLLNDGERKGWL